MLSSEALHEVPQIPRDRTVPKQVPGLGQPQDSELLVHEITPKQAYLTIPRLQCLKKAPQTDPIPVLTELSSLDSTTVLQGYIFPSIAHTSL